MRVRKWEPFAVRPAFKPTHIPYILSVIGHGIHHEIIDGLFSVMKAYLSLPLEVKMKVAVIYESFIIRQLKIYKGTPPFWTLTLTPPTEAIFWRVSGPGGKNSFSRKTLRACRIPRSIH
ncbi:hypothetical protein SCLCIDRAFT_591542 [Scleroderma citrinum Foug A]|uniref:Uncharacterized protein n=1 Tax=Scleroderma citrinum Foug A TaxID=1036808 RepID=A0A0C3E9U2_9AGAM|nr:hypothetical protein SCLCIDRAFT_591542 [Scleroderma citrinum Foug A]